MQQIQGVKIYRSDFKSLKHKITGMNYLRQDFGLSSSAVKLTPLSGPGQAVSVHFIDCEKESHCFKLSDLRQALEGIFDAACRTIGFCGYSSS